MAKQMAKTNEQMEVSGLCFDCVSYPVIYKSKTVSPVFVFAFCCALLRG